MPSKQITQIVRNTLSGAKVTFTNIFDALHTPQPVDQKVRDRVVLPKPVVVSPEQDKALGRLPEILAGFAWPDTRRKVSSADKRRAIELLEILRIVESLTGDVRESLRTTVLNHGDVVLEELAQVGETTPRDKDGHYVIGDPDEFSIPGLAASIYRSATLPKASVTAAALQAIIAKPEDEDWDEDTRITRQEYLALTKATRVTDEKRVLEFVRAHPDRAVAIKNAAQQSGGSLSMLESKNSG